MLRLDDDNDNDLDPTSSFERWSTEADTAVAICRHGQGASHALLLDSLRP